MHTHIGSHGRGAEHRPCCIQEKAVLGIIDHDALKTGHIDHGYVRLAGLDISHSHPIHINGRMGTAKTSEAHGLEPGIPAVIPHMKSRALHQHIRNR